MFIHPRVLDGDEAVRPNGCGDLLGDDTAAGAFIMDINIRSPFL